MKNAILLYLFTAYSLMTHEILSKLSSLHQIQVTVEIFNFFPDLPHSTYTFNQIPPTTIELPTIQVNYLPSNLSITSPKYWEIINFLNQKNRNYSDFPKFEWNTFQIFLIHSTNFTLFKNFQFSPEDCCDLIKFPFKASSKRVFIECHPLEKVGIQEIHAIFLQTLKSSSFFDWVFMYNGLLNKTIEDLKPVIATEEDTKALFFKQNEQFEKDFNEFYNNLFLLKALAQHENSSKFSEILIFLQKTSKFKVWCEELPENSPTLVIPFSLFFTFFTYFVLVSEIIYHKFRSYKSD